MSHPDPKLPPAHLSADTLAALLTGAATPTQERQALAHFLAACPTCAATAARIVESLGLGARSEDRQEVG